MQSASWVRSVALSPKLIGGLGLPMPIVSHRHIGVQLPSAGNLRAYGQHVRTERTVVAKVAQSMYPYNHHRPRCYCQGTAISTLNSCILLLKYIQVAYK